MNFQYQYPEAFWLLFLVPLLALLYGGYFLWQRRTTKRIGDAKLIASLTKNHSPLKSRIKFFLFLAAFALGCLSLANPRKPDDESAEVRKGIDAVIALDVSNSMTATDVQPSRLLLAQKMLTSLIDKMPNDRIGLVVFAGNAYTQMPLSTDHEAAKLFVNTASPAMVPEQGTAVGDALLQSTAAFEEGSQRFKTIILVTDGETHDEDALKTAQDLAKKGVMINTVGLGSASGSTLLDTLTHSPKKDEGGQVVVSKLNEALLQQLATTTNGAYIHLEAVAPATATLLDQYKNVDKKALLDTSGLLYESFYWWLVLPMTLLLLVELFIPDKKGFRMKTVLLLLLFFSTKTFAQTAAYYIAKGNENYLRLEFDLAEDQYRKALDKAPHNADAQYNLGNALMQQKKYKAAVEAYEAVTTDDKSIKAAAHYNAGVSYSKQEDVPASIEAYKAALRLNPADKDARENLQKALTQQKQQQQNEQKNKGGGGMNQNDADKKLRELEQKESDLQRKLQQGQGKGQGGGKDW